VVQEEYQCEKLKEESEMRIGPFHITEILGGVAGVTVVGVLVRPTPVILGVIAFVVGQVVVRAMRIKRGL